MGKDLGQYQFRNVDDGQYSQIRKVKWLGTVKRDQLSTKAKK